jgi:hypothetical protein
LKKVSNQIYHDNTKIYQLSYIGILLIILGVFFLCFPNFVSIKISITVTLIGFFIIILRTGEKTANHFSDLLIISIIIAWTIIVYFIITITDFSIDAIFILIIIGLLVISEFMSESLPFRLRNRLYFSIFAFFLIFLILILYKILVIAIM